MVSVTPLQRISLTAGLTAVRPVTGPTPVGPATKAEEILPADPLLEVARGAAALRLPDVLGTPTPAAQKAVTAAVQTAVARQTGLAPLMADLAEAAAQPSLPPALRQAATQVLAQRTPLTPGLQAADVQDALARSGLLMEARIADGGPSPTPRTDLKAALLTLRQTLQAVVANAPAASSAPAASPQSAAATRAAPPPAGAPQTLTSPAPAMANAPTGAAPRLLARIAAAADRPAELAPLIEDLAQAVHAEDLPPQVRNAAAQVLARLAPPQGPAAAPEEAPAEAQPPQDDVGEPGSGDPPAARTAAAPGSSPVAAQPRAPNPAAAPAMPRMPTLLAAQAGESQPALEAARLAESEAPAQADLRAVLQTLRQTLQAFIATAPQGPVRPGAKSPPPPFRGGPTQGQAPVDAELPAAAGAAARRLLTETNGALARQQLMQAASLPPQHEGAAPATRWMFEVPFATPHGSAVGQFEIAREPPAAGAADSDPTWRARFSLDLAALGPLHAHVSLSGAHVGVAMWAEKAAGLSALRQHQQGLAKALLAARLSPDIAIYPGQPVSAQAAPGHFVDQAL